MSAKMGRRTLLSAATASMLVIAAGRGRAKDSDPAKVYVGAPRSLPGPKRTIAVGAIDVIGPYANASATNVGGPIAAMLSTALEECGAFLVVERDALPGLVTEMELAKSGVSAGSSAPHPGGVIPAQFLVVGAVTDFTAQAAGSGGGVSVGGLSLGGSKGDVALDLRVVDTHSGAVIKAFKVQRKLTSMNVGLSGSYKGTPIATNGFFNSPLGDATRQALNDAVEKIIAIVSGLPWQGQVVKVDGQTVYVNAGSDAGVAIGDRLMIRRVSETFTDPATGQVLSQHFADLGVVTIGSVEPKLAVGALAAPPGNSAPVRGDLLVYVH